MTTKLPPGTLDRLWADSNNWRANLIYVCKADPRFIVPKRNKWGGWTLNFAHASAWMALLVSLLSIGLPSLYLAKERLLNTWIWYAFLVGVIAISCILSWFLSSPRRYEESQ